MAPLRARSPRSLRRSRTPVAPCLALASANGSSTWTPQLSLTTSSVPQSTRPHAVIPPCVGACSTSTKYWQSQKSPSRPRAGWLWWPPSSPSTWDHVRSSDRRRPPYLPADFATSSTTTSSPESLCGRRRRSSMYTKTRSYARSHGHTAFRPTDISRGAESRWHADSCWRGCRRQTSPRPPVSTTKHTSLDTSSDSSARPLAASSAAVPSFAELIASSFLNAASHARAAPTSARGHPEARESRSLSSHLTST